jgi:hypothetical protein
MSAITANTSVSAYLPTPPSTPPPADILAAAKEDLGWALPPNGLHTVLGQFVVFLYEDHINSGCSRPPALDKAQTFYFDVEWIRSRQFITC